MNIHSMKSQVKRKLKPLPVGISDYVRAQAEYYYVDKTLLIKEFLDQKPLVSLFTRPRRFGKTLNMDMLRVFYEKDFFSKILDGVATEVELTSALEKLSKMLTEYYGVSDKEKELREWYDGYLFGNTEIYNPWSVINYVARGCIPQPYWVNTGRNEVLENVLKIATEDITEKLYALLQGECVIAKIDQNVVYRSLSEDPANIYSLLLTAGYLKAPRKELQADGAYLCEVSIPNREISAVYKSEIMTQGQNLSITD